MALRGATKKGDPNKGGSLQLGFFMPESDWKPPDLVDLPEFSKAKRIAYDTETYDPELRRLGPGFRRTARVVGHTVTIDGGPSLYLPVAHEGGGNMDRVAVTRYLKDQFSKFEGEIVGAKLDYDIDAATSEGISFNSNAMFRDIQIADPLIYELHRSYSLAAIGERYGIEAKDEKILIEAGRAHGLDPKAGLWRLHSKYVGAYGEQDGRGPLEIYAKQREILTNKDLWRVFDLESRVLPLLVKMRQRGILIDWDRLDQLEKKYLRTEAENLAFIKEQTGYDIGVGNVWKPNAMAPALLALGLEIPKDAKGNYSISNDMLERLDHPVGAALRTARKFNKMRTTFAASMYKYETNGRIHCTYHQIARETEGGDQKGVKYGRLSATDPNLQQQPSKDRDPVVAAEWRTIFLPEPGSLWACVDFKQQEPKWVTHYAAIMNLPKAMAMAMKYRNDPLADNHDMMTELIHGEGAKEWMDAAEFKNKRTHAKVLFLGLCYGEGGAKLCRDLRLPTRWALYRYGQPPEYFETRHDAWVAMAGDSTARVNECAGEEGQNIIDKFMAEVPFVPKLAEKAKEQVALNGYVKTIAGRRLHFTRKDNGQYDYTHKAMNRVIQGTSADQTKQSMLDIDEAGFYLQLQVHDENNASVGTDAEAKRMGDIMQHAVNNITEPMLPFTVDVETGPNWGDIKAAA